MLDAAARVNVENSAILIGIFHLFPQDRHHIFILLILRTLLDALRVLRNVSARVASLRRLINAVPETKRMTFLVPFLIRNLEPLTLRPMPAKILHGATSAPGEIHPTARLARHIRRYDNVLVGHDAAPINLTREKRNVDRKSFKAKQVNWIGKFNKATASRRRMCTFVIE